MVHEPLDGPGETAIGAAMMRAEESLRGDRLFDDPLAAAFARAAPDAFADGPSPDDPEVASLTERFCAHMAVRTRFYDEFVRSAAKAGYRQFVFLGAGLDARAFRLDWLAGTRVFEIDVPAVLSFKQRVIDQHDATARCTRITVSVDLRDDWPTALATAGFRFDHPTAWIAEGLLSYLSDSEATHLLARITQLSQPNSRLALDAAQLTDDGTLQYVRGVGAYAGTASMWHGLERDASTWLTNHGWTVAHHDRAELALRWNRATSDATTGGYLTATLPRRNASPRPPSTPA